MTVSQEIQTVIKQHRIILTALRTPKLRERFKELLAQQDTDEKQSPVTQTSLDKPFQQIEWLNTSGSESQEILGHHIDILNIFLGEILLCTPGLSVIYLLTGKNVKHSFAVFANVFLLPLSLTVTGSQNLSIMPACPCLSPMRLPYDVTPSIWALLHEVIEEKNTGLLNKA